MNRQFGIYVFFERLIDILPYNYEAPNWRKLLNNPPSGEVLFTDKDVEVYNWENQEILLNISSSKRLIGLNLIEKSFIVYLGERPLFGGSFIEQGSARAINYPVIYINKSQPQIIFQLRPIHLMFESYQTLNKELKGRIELEDIKNHFRTLGKISSSTQTNLLIHNNVGEVQGVIFSETQSLDIGDLPLRSSVVNRWRPTTQDILDTGEHLREYLKSSKHPKASWIQNRILSYKCQYIGYMEDQKRFIYINALSNSFADRNERWMYEYLSVQDGGPNFFQAIYDFDAGKIDWFNVNGEA